MRKILNEEGEDGHVEYLQSVHYMLGIHRALTILAFEIVDHYLAETMWSLFSTIFYIFTYSLLQFSLSLFDTGRPLFSLQPSLVLHLLFVTRSSVERQLFKSSAFLVSTLEVRFPYPLADGGDVHLQVIWENLTRTLVESRPKGLFSNLEFGVLPLN